MTEAAQEKRPVTLITGGSAGIGAALAHEFAANGHEVVLLARREQALNALNRQTLNEIGWALRDADGDARVRCLIFTGAGKAFVAGADIGEMADQGATEARGFAGVHAEAG